MTVVKLLKSQYSSFCHLWNGNIISTFLKVLFRRVKEWQFLEMCQPHNGLMNARSDFFSYMNLLAYAILRVGCFGFFLLVTDSSD